MIWTIHALDQLAARCPDVLPEDAEQRAETITYGEAYRCGCLINDQHAEFLYDRISNLFLVVKSDEVVVTVVRPVPEAVRRRGWSKKMTRRRQKWC